MKNKKTKIAILAVIALILVTIGVTYAYWLVTRTQTGENQITAGCLDIAISGEANDISLTNQFPMSDEDGMELVPYEFTVTNNCNTSVDYQVALEATGDSSNALAATSLKVALNDTVTLLSNNAEVDTTVSGAYESRVIGYSRLAASGSEGSSVTYKLRIWIDEDTPISEMNKTFKSRISVTIGQGIESPYEEEMLAAGLYDENDNLIVNWEDSGIDDTLSNSAEIIEGYGNITKVIIPDSVTSISYGAFYFCEGITSVIIPDSVTSISESAFAHTSITSIAIPDSVTSIEGLAFESDSISTIYYSGAATGAPWGATNATILPYSEAPAELLP